MEKKKVIGLLFGGQSSEHAVSCVSAASMLKNIDKEKYNVISIGITRDGKWFVYRGENQRIENGTWISDEENLIPAVISPCSAHHGLLLLDKENQKYVNLPLDCVLSILHGENGEDGVMQGLLKLSGVPFVGCDTRSSAITMDKAAAKALVSEAGVPVAKAVVVTKNDYEHNWSAIEKKIMKLRFPVFVKPAGTGSSVGITKAKNETELDNAMVEAFKYDDKVLVEKYMRGKEIECAVLERDGEICASVCGEIESAGEFYDYESKYHNAESKTHIPARIPEYVSDMVREYAIKIFYLLGCHGFSRVDFFVEGSDITFNEINTLPGFTEISLYPALWAHMGLSYKDLLTAFIENVPENR